MVSKVHAYALLDEIVDQSDIVDMIIRRMPLQRAGTTWKGRCPFHAEHTPSFTVFPTEKLFYCSGCGAGGDIFGFLVRHDRLSFRAAVHSVARTIGREISGHWPPGD